jgi:single-strand DNA-binding protein
MFCPAFWVHRTVDLEDFMTVESTPRGRRTNHRNEVLLIGQLSGLATARVLRNGTPVVTWRLVVRRPIVVPGRPSYDTVDCLSLAVLTRKYAPLWRLGDVIACQGALHRRFWRSSDGTMSRCEVEVATAHRVARSRTRANPQHLP